MITAVAIMHNGVMHTGTPGKDRHHDLIHKIAQMMPIKRIVGEQGFVDEKFKFYNRMDAARHAIDCKQVIMGQAKIRHEFNGRELYSEDLW